MLIIDGHHGDIDGSDPMRTDMCHADADFAKGEESEGEQSHPGNKVISSLARGITGTT